jgi:hypothetical protein
VIAGLAVMVAAAFVLGLRCRVLALVPAMAIVLAVLLFNGATPFEVVVSVVATELGFVAGVVAREILHLG